MENGQCISCYESGRYTNCLIRGGNDRGPYLCIAGRPENCSISNAISYESSSIALNVTCFNGNSPITGYLLYFRKTSSSEWKNLTTTAENNNLDIAEVVLRDLDAFTHYDLQVKGENTHGYEDRDDSFSIMKTVRTAEGG